MKIKIKVNGKVFSGELTERLVENIANEIKKLPEPNVKPLHSVPMQDQETGLCLQREAFHLDKFQIENKIRFLGSKAVFDCIVVYIRNETDHLVVHHDSSPIDFVPLLEKFNDKANITVSLAGGLPGKDKALSEDKLRKIIISLCQASE